MSYLTDNPYPLMILLAAVAAVAMLTGTAKGRGITGLCVVLIVGVYFLEQVLISPAEEVEGELHSMLQHFKERDVAAITQQISPNSPELIEIATRGLELVDLSESFHIKNVDVTIAPDEVSATALVRANGTITLRQQGGGGGYFPSFWRTVWMKESDHWKLTEVIRLNPANGQEMPYFARR